MRCELIWVDFPVHGVVHAFPSPKLLCATAIAIARMEVILQSGASEALVDTPTAQQHKSNRAGGSLKDVYVYAGGVATVVRQRGIAGRELFLPDPRFFLSLILSEWAHYLIGRTIICFGV